MRPEHQTCLQWAQVPAPGNRGTVTETRPTGSSTLSWGKKITGWGRCGGGRWEGDAEPRTALLRPASRPACEGRQGETSLHAEENQRVRGTREKREPPAVPDSVTPWTAARQAPLSMGFSGQGHWSDLPFSSPGGRDEQISGAPCHQFSEGNEPGETEPAGDLSRKHCSLGLLLCKQRESWLIPEMSQRQLPLIPSDCPRSRSRPKAPQLRG